MFSSGNRSKENNQSYPTQWALNPSAYQNVSNEHVDWAALAQQWIMMKESVPPEHPSTGAGNRKEILNEGGEAPMDVEKEDAEEQWPTNEAPNTTVQESWNWQQWGAWPGNWNGPPPAAGVVPQPATVTPMNKTALLPTPYTHFAPNTSDSNSAHSTDYQSHFSYDGAGSSGGNDFGGSSSGYWTNSGAASRGKHPMKPNRTHRKGFSSDIRPEPSSEPVTLDAAKRRQLPAWIREGLEKMEREKQKQLDRERERIEREEMLNRKKEEKEEALELLRSGDGSILPPKSKFDSDSGDSGDETRNGGSSRSRPPSTKSRRSMPPSRPSSPPLALTEEERMAMVRRAMTEVLLQVTSSEIDTICQEEVNRFRARTTAKKGGRPAAPSAGPFAAGTLGLGMYGGGSSDSGSESEGPGPSQAVLGDDHADNERRNSSFVNNSVFEDGLDSKRQQNKESVRRRQSDSQSRRPHNVEVRDAGSSDSTADDGKEGGEQVDTTRSHGNGSSRLRGERHRRSSSSNSNSSTSSSRTSSSETNKSKRKKKKSSIPKKKLHGRSPRRNRRSSSSQSDDDSSSGSKTSDTRTTSSRDVNRRNQQTRRNRSRSVDSDKRRSVPSCSASSSSKRRRSRSVSSGSESRGDSHRRRAESSTNNRNHNDRSRRERSPSRSRHNTRSRRSRSRSRDRRDRRRSRSRTRSRDRRDSYRSRRRSRSRTRSRSGGGKRTRGH